MTEDRKTCPFCQLDTSRIFFEDELVRAFSDKYPVSNGHTLIVPRRHIASWFDATRDELEALTAATAIVRARVERLYAPDGYNIGVNVGEAAGQTVFHLHVHVIPRYSGDVDDPTGGVRHVIADLANYRRAGEASSRDGLTRPRLTLGGEVPLLPWLIDCFERSVHADVAVAFVQTSGLVALGPIVNEFLESGGTIRLVTGDYLGITAPEALEQLCDLADTYPGQCKIRMFTPENNRAFHPKAYSFLAPDGTRVSYVGSANMTRPALVRSVEWCYRVEDPQDLVGNEEIRKAFESLWNDANCVPLTHEWVAEYCLRRPDANQRAVTGLELEPSSSPPLPRELQKEALNRLVDTRAMGNRTGLVVMATGLGKTWLAAFDASSFEAKRILFVAHREEILRQACSVFRSVMPGVSFGFYRQGDHQTSPVRVLFASVQTIGREAHLNRFDQQEFDYVIIDEFHHAVARSYKRLIEHFEPDFFLGLTATPERRDGGRLLALCGENLIYRCDLHEAIWREQLCPFHYFGVPDGIDYQNIPWRGRRFDEAALTAAWETRARADNALEQYKRLAGKRTLAFCCSVAHATFMRNFFRDNGVRASAVHSGDDSDPRTSSLERLAADELDVVFSVDMFNEGVDIPAVDTVMMLRPTDSPVVFLQQLGRGLRKTEGKTHLTVIDYIGNHRSFLIKPLTLLGLETSRPQELREALAFLRQDALELPPGCEVTYELEILDLLERLTEPGTAREVIARWYERWCELHGERPTALEAFHDGVSMDSLRGVWGSWLDLVRAMSGTGEAGLLWEDNSPAAAFLRALETTQMTRSYKMVLLQATLEAGGLPNAVHLDEIAKRALRHVRDHVALVQDFGSHAESLDALAQCLVNNPIHFLLEGRGMGGRQFFVFEENRFGLAFGLGAAETSAFRERASEIVEWRMAKYLDGRRSRDHTGVYRCKVSSRQRHPIIRLDRSLHLDLPSGSAGLDIAGKKYVANFARIAVNAICRSGSEENLLPRVLFRWFGPNAGKPGTSFWVRIVRDEHGGLSMMPDRTKNAGHK